MIEIGIYNNLRLGRFSDSGAYLKDSDENEVLLPNKYVADDFQIGDNIDVFIYKDSEDRLVATTLKPLVERNQFACLEVKDVNNIGAFLDWGLEKDLLVPFSEQERNMRSGQWHLVYVYLDQRSNRMLASTKIHFYLEKENVDLVENQEVNVIIGNTTENGTQCIIENKYIGLLYENEVFEDLFKGEHRKAYVKHVREDKKVDLSLRKVGLDNLEDAAKKIIEALDRNGGSLPLHDKSAPEEIQLMLKMSKKNFKKSIGILYKKKLISLNDKTISKI